MMDSQSFDEGICAIANKLSYGDIFLYEELRSEMHIAILGMKEGRDKGYYFRAAKNAAIDYLRSKKWNYSYAAQFPHMSLDSMIEAGFQIDTEGNLYLPDHFLLLEIFEDEEKL